MTNLLHWLVSSWKSLAVSGVFGFLGGIVGGTFKWFVPSYKAWKEGRQTKAAKKLDALVLVALTDPSVTRSSKGMTGAGAPLNRVGEIAAHLKREYEEVHESLVRLHMHDRVRESDGVWFRIPD
jgi:hypothetical protein